MDLSFKPEHEAFRQEVRDFLDEELTDELREAGKLTASVFSEVEYSSKWHKILYNKGWIGSRWPEEYGGHFYHGGKEHILQPGTFLCFDPLIEHRASDIKTTVKRIALDFTVAA